MVTMGDGAGTSLALSRRRPAATSRPSRSDVELFGDAYAGRARRVRRRGAEGPDPVGDRRGRPARALASRSPASRRSRPAAPGRRGRDVASAGAAMSAVHAGGVRRDGLRSTCPVEERVALIHDPASPSRSGTGRQGPRRPGRDRRALHLDDRLRRGRASSTPTGADALLRTAEQSVARAPASARARRTSTCTAPASDGRGLPVRPVETVTGAMWLAAVETLRRVADARASARASCSAWRTSTPPSTTPARPSPGPPTPWRSSRPSTARTCG